MNWSDFFNWDAYGPLHLVLLHVPIGLFVGVLALELGLSRDKHQEAHDQAVGVLLPLCLLSAILTVRFGYALGQTDYDWDAIGDHRVAGYYFLGALTASLLTFWWSRWKPNIVSGGLYCISLTAAAITLILTGHSGGVITHGEDALESIPGYQLIVPEPEPEPAVPVVIVPGVEPANPYTDEAWLILDQHCVECHGLNKRKGGYRIDVPRLARSGGDSNRKGIIPGDPDASFVIHRVELPRDNEHAMPPSKKPGLTPEQIDLLRLWIKTGAQFPGEENQQKDKLDPETVQQMEALRGLGAAADFTPWGDGTVLVDLSQMETADWETLAPAIHPLADKLAWLNAANQDWPAPFYDQLKDFPKLERLHLQHSNVTDADIPKLAALKQLDYLNLTSTQVTLEGIKTALELPALAELFIHGLDLNPKELNKLRKAHPDIDIAGLSNQEFATEEKK